MSTTTIRIDDQLKERVADAAERAGKTPHAFIVDAIAQTVEQAEAEHAFHQDAGERWDRVVADAKVVAWEDLKPYLVARAAGKPARRPRPRKLAR